MNYESLHFDDLGVTAQTATFIPENNGIKEWHIILHAQPQGELFEGQLKRIYSAEDRLTKMPQFAGAHCIMKRYFLSDSANQQPLMRKETGATLSVIQQQPLDGSKIAAWLYFVEDVNVEVSDGMTTFSHNGYRHLWKMGIVDAEGDSAQQTTSVLETYEKMLENFDATLANNCIRTWFFVRDVDTQYAGMVKARRENFVKQGLTEHTHYISSTGIGGIPADTHALIQLGAYALTGFQPEQQRFLHAPTHLNPTYEYGVTFERGTSIEYGDRRQVFISGTASINNRGEVVHIGDVVKQTERMWENVETLLAESDITFDDVMQIIVYLRDTADYDLVKQMFTNRFPYIPTIITLAPVCRPAWLIEMECIAVKECHNNRFRAF